MISSVNYNVEDYVIRGLLMNDSLKSGLKECMRFNVNMLEEERNKISQYLMNRGYYRFNKDYITFQADTVRGGRPGRNSKNSILWKPLTKTR